MTKSPRAVRDQLIRIAEPVCAGAGYELVDLRFVNENGSWVVRVYIDHADGPEGAHIGFSDCENISRELSAVFDVEDPISHAYRLEVSSPGVDRPLRTAEHFERFAGERARISLATGLDGRRNFTGVLSGVTDADSGPAIRLDVDGSEFVLPLGDVSSARLVPDWDRPMSGTKAGSR